MSIFSSRCSHRTVVACSVLAATLAPLAGAQLVLPPPQYLSPPPAPVILAPTAATQVGTTGNRTALTVEWSHASIRNLFTPIWARANYFLVCLDVDRGTSTPACSVSTADWTESASSPSAALQTAWQRATFAPGRFLGSTEIDVPMRITVGACRALNQLSCSFSSVTTYYSSRNAIAVGTGDAPQSTANTWVIDVRARNSGTSPLPAFSGRVSVYAALGVGSPGRTCRVDIDAPDVRNNPDIYLIDERGFVINMVDVERLRINGVYTGAPPIGLYQLNDPTYGRVFRTPYNPSVSAASAPGQQSQTTGVGTVSVAIPANNLQSTFVVVSALDSNSELREFDERDNTHAQCKRR